MLQILLTLMGYLVLVVPMGWYLYKVAEKKSVFGDRFFNPIEKTVYKLCGLELRDMTWQQYAKAILLTNALMVILGYAVLRMQAIPLLNPNNIGDMEQSLSFNTIISFMTNTNLQHYSGESGLSYLSQTLVIIYMMFTSAATGYSACMAFARGITGMKALGNYYVDMTRLVLRVLLPLALVVGLLLVFQGTPQTMGANVTLTTLEGKQQDIALGPIASLVSIKHLGTNGGGFLGANSSTPQENPTIISNILELYSMMLLPGACVLVFGGMVLSKRRKTGGQPEQQLESQPGHQLEDQAESQAGSLAPNQAEDSLGQAGLRSQGSYGSQGAYSQGYAAPGKQPGLLALMGGEARTIFMAMGMLLLLGLAVCYWAESAGNPALAQVGLSQANGSMEGKEVRLGIAQSSLFTTVTTSFTTGTVNNMHDTLTPLGGLVPLFQMLLNVVYGGVGVGFMNMLMYMLLAVFICGLMVGRTPEYLGKKVEAREMKLVALVLILHPLLVLGFSALAVSVPQGLAGITNPSFHGLSQVLYEYASASANNGSGFEGLADNNLFWNITTGLAMFYGRYIPIVLQLAIAGAMLVKQPMSISTGTLRTDTVMFPLILTGLVLIFAALTFFPALALGPVAEHLVLWK